MSETSEHELDLIGVLECCEAPDILPSSIVLTATGVCRRAWLCERCGQWVVWRWVAADPSKRMMEDAARLHPAVLWHHPSSVFIFPRHRPWREIRQAYQDRYQL